MSHKLPYYSRTVIESQITSLLNSILIETEGCRKALVLRGLPGSGRETMLRHLLVSNSQYSFKTFTFDLLTHNIRQEDGSKKNKEKIFDLTSKVIHEFGTDLGQKLIIDILSFILKDEIFKNDVPVLNGPNDLEDYLLTLSKRNPIIVIFKNIDPFNIETLFELVKLIELLSNKPYRICLIFFDSTRLGENYHLSNHLRKILLNKELLQEIPFIESTREDLERFLKSLGLHSSWSKFLIHLCQGNLGLLNSYWRLLQDEQVLTEGKNGKWSTTGLPTQSVSDGLTEIMLSKICDPTIRSFKIDLRRNIHDCLLIASCMGEAFQPIHVVEAALTSDLAVSKDTFLQLHNSFCEFLTACNDRTEPLAFPLVDKFTVGGKDRMDVPTSYRFYSDTLRYTLSIQAQRLCRPGQADKVFRSKIEFLLKLMNQQTHSIGSSVLLSLSALMRTLGKQIEANHIEAHWASDKLKHQLSKQVDNESREVANGKPAYKLYELLLWYADELKFSGDYKLALEIMERARDLIAKSQVQLGPTYIAKFYLRYAMMLSHNKYLKEAEETIRNSISMFEEEDVIRDSEFGIALYKMSEILGEQGKFTEAENICAKSINFFRYKLIPTDYLELAAAMNAQAFINIHQHKFDVAIGILLEVVRIKEQFYRGNSIHLTSNLNNLGVAFSNMRQFDDAEKCYRRVLDIEINRLGPQHPKVAITLSNLADVFFNQNKLDIAEQYFKLALENMKLQPRPNDRSLTPILTNYAVCLNAQGKYLECENLLYQGLKIVEQGLGSDHPSSSPLLMLLSQVLRQKQDFDTALVYRRKALELNERTYGVDNPMTAEDLLELGHIQLLRGAMGEAVHYVKTAIHVFEAIYKGDHPKTSESHRIYAEILLKLGDLGEALTHAERASQMILTTLGSDTREFDVTLATIAEIETAQGKNSKAIEKFRFITEHAEKRYGADHPEFAKELNNYGKALLKANRFEEAISIQKRSFDIMLKQLGNDHPLTRLAKNNYDYILDCAKGCTREIIL